MQEVLPPNIENLVDGQAIDPLTPQNFNLKPIEYSLLTLMQLLKQK